MTKNLIIWRYYGNFLTKGLPKKIYDSSNLPEQSRIEATSIIEFMWRLRNRLYLEKRSVL